MLKNLSFPLIMIIILPLMGLWFLDNLFVLWLFMEVQLIFYLLHSWTTSGSNSKFMFFLMVQLISSLYLIFTIFLSNFLVSSYVINSIFYLVLFLKMGFFPFHFWFLNFMKSLTILDYFLFLTFMKIIPIVLFFHLLDTPSMVLIFFNMVFSSLYLNMYNSIKKLLFFSSVLNTMFFFVLYFFINLDMAKLFLLFYFIVLFMLAISLDYQDLNYIFGSLLINKNLSLKLYIYSLVGVPFSIGFLLKSLLVASYFYMNLIFFFMSILLFTSVMFSVYYMKIVMYMYINSTYMYKSMIHLPYKNLMMNETMFMMSMPVLCCLFFLSSRYIIF